MGLEEASVKKWLVSAMMAMYDGALEKSWFISVPRPLLFIIVMNVVPRVVGWATVRAPVCR